MFYISTKEMVYWIVEKLTEEKLQGFIVIFKSFVCIMYMGYSQRLRQKNTMRKLLRWEDVNSEY